MSMGSVAATYPQSFGSLQALELFYKLSSPLFLHLEV